MFEKMDETIPGETEKYNRNNPKFKKLILKKILTESEINYLVKNYYPSYDSSDSSDDSSEEDQDIDVEGDKQLEEGVADVMEQVVEEVANPKAEENQSQNVLETNVCDICDKELSSKYSLKLHKERVHLKMKKFICDHQGCDGQFFTKHILLRHKKTVHQNIFISNENKCDKKSANVLDLKTYSKLNLLDVTKSPAIQFITLGDIKKLGGNSTKNTSFIPISSYFQSKQ